MSIIIIGSGFAGAACAWWLGQLGAKDITVLEQEDAPGLHASGLNAGLAREYEEDEAIAPLAKEGVEFIRNPPKGFVDAPLIECNGSLLLFDAGSGRLEAGRSSFMPLASSFIDRAEVVKKVPPLVSAKFDQALWTPTDGIVDIHSYLWAFINGAKVKGARFVMGEKIRKIEAGSGKLEAGKIYKYDVLVNATGGWAQMIGDMAGAEDLQIKPYRRHLFQTPQVPEVDPKWPFVWDSTHQYYFRPESGGLLLGACDEEEVKPGTPSTDPKVMEILAQKLSTYCPALSGVSIMRQWCGLRTFAPDKRPVIRWDKKVKGFYWLAGLGGRGMTCAASAGRKAAEDIINGYHQHS